MKRDWSQARAKVQEEARCRSCGHAYGLESAHIVPRSRIGAGFGGEDPRNVIPLCGACHRAQHAGRLELLPLLTREEESYVVSLVGIAEAFRRTTSRDA